jgi:alkylmercury lyase
VSVLGTCCAAPDALGLEDYLLDNPPELQELALTIYRGLARGDAVDLEAVAAGYGSAIAEIRKLVRRFPSSAIEHDPSGRIVAFFGLSLAPTRHRLELAGRTLFTWCAFDALFLPQVLRSPARVRSNCPASGVDIEIELSPEAILRHRPAGVVMSVVHPGGDNRHNDLRGAFCRHVHFLRDRSAYEDWRSERSGTGCVALAEAHAMGRRRNADRFRDIGL